MPLQALGEHAARPREVLEERVEAHADRRARARRRCGRPRRRGGWSSPDEASRGARDDSASSTSRSIGSGPLCERSACSAMATARSRSSSGTGRDFVLRSSLTARLRAMRMPRRRSPLGRPSATKRGATCHTRSSASWRTDSTSSTLANDRRLSRIVPSAPAIHCPKARVSPVRMAGRWASRSMVFVVEVRCCAQRV